MTGPMDDFDSMFGGDPTPVSEPAQEPTPELPQSPNGDVFAPSPDEDVFGVSGGAGAGSEGVVDLDLLFLTSVIHGGRVAFRDAINRGITAERVLGPARKGFDFALQYLAEHGQTPSVDQVLARVGLVLPDKPPSGPPQYWAEELLSRHLHLDLQGRMGVWAGHLEARQPRDAFADMQRWMREQTALYTPLTVEPLFGHLPALKARFLRRKAGERGIQTPWPIVNDLTFGLYPEQVWLIVARSGVGKTWAAVLYAYTAWLAGKRVLFATTEMSQEDITARFIALHLKLPFHDFQAGRLSDVQERVFFESCETLLEDDRLKIIGGDFDFKPESYEAGIERARPDLSVLDGAYLLKMPGKSRTDAAAEAANEIKRIGKRQKVAQILTSQFNREAKADDPKSGAQEKVALTDAAVWNSTVILALAQTKDMRQDGIMQARVLKNREGPLGDPFFCNWRFQSMDFSQQQAPGQDTDNEFDPGVQGPAPALASDPFEVPPPSYRPTDDGPAIF